MTRRRRRERDEHKTAQLCRQVERRLSLVFAGELGDQQLEGIALVGVTPLEGASLLRIEVALPPGRPKEAGPEVIARLEGASSWLRREVAAAIHRKRTPTLTFALAELPLPEEEDEDG